MFCENEQYAHDRLLEFSSSQRTGKILDLYRKLSRVRNKVVHFCALAKGGAAGATLNIHKALLAAGWDSWFVTREQERKRLDPNIPNVRFLSAEQSIDFQHLEMPVDRGLTTFSVDDEVVSNSSLAKIVDRADVVNIAWGAKFLSWRNIAYLSGLGVPVTLTVRDMNVLTGGCHYFHGCAEWQRECSPCPQCQGFDDNYPSLVLKEKLKNWNPKTLSFVVLSSHSEGIFRRSRFANHYSVKMLPNFVDTGLFYPDRLGGSLSRRSWNLPEGHLIIGYLPSFDSYVKGHSELVAGLTVAVRRFANLRVALVMLTGNEIDTENIPVPVLRLSHTDDRQALRRFYNGVDVIAVPSLEETFSNTALESMACGTPVIGFKTGVLAEIFDEGFQGQAVAVGDYSALADVIGSLPDLLARGTSTREDLGNRISERFSKGVIISAYLSHYNDLISAIGLTQTHSSPSTFEAAWLKRKATMAVKRLRDLRNQVNQKRG